MLKLCAYALRHGHAHWRIVSGTDSYIVSKLLGHADGRMLETRYGHAEQDAAYMLAGDCHPHIGTTKLAGIIAVMAFKFRTW